MRKETLALVRQVRKDIHLAEAANDASLGHLGKLLASTCLGKADAELELEVGREAISRIIAAIRLMGQARAVTFDVHSSLTMDAKRILPLSIGDWDSPGIAKMLEASETPDLRVVNAA
ncbi:hypothetical protein [Sphingomonas quercus]|uniref:Uncharacterized protein n=1 Tax=Sphingomonas quercus TaxID=2842451 RepID=A0ABS6BDN9_9SPHN|nr:hypothetical protein [Sphingomonas quercus]MBU3076430.1 hypothetical protein [Sphingomonas quercus]